MAARSRARQGCLCRYTAAMRPNHPLSRIANQVMWDRLIAVVEEQAQTLVRTAFGTPTREAGDLSAGVYDTQGRMLAQAVTGTPGHVNSMAMSVGHVLKKIPLADMAEGDVFILNDPWQGTGHLNDIVIVTPTFRQRQGGRLLRRHPARGRYRRPRHRRRGAAGLRGGDLHPHHQDHRQGQGQPVADGPDRRQRARADPGAGRHLLADLEQRDRRPPPQRHDGRVRARASRRSLPAHPRP